MQTAAAGVRSFAKEEDGAQVIEYALIIAVVSIALIVSLAGLKSTSFASFITKVGTCLGGTCT
jgi:pilus assembly protein Flp/PilA